jgi:hypothetical protein
MRFYATDLLEPGLSPRVLCSGASGQWAVQMKRTFLLFTMSLLLFMPPVFGRMPELSVQAICKARLADARMLRSPPDQSMADCMRDEEAQKQMLNKVWASYAVSIRNRCVSDARALGTTSYLEILSCIQMSDDLKSTSHNETAK